jgi:hydrogenase maturation protease
MAEPFRDMLVIGVGNPHRGDDAIGPLLARRLASGVSPGISTVESDGEPAALLELLSHAPGVIIVDAADFGATPGEVLRVDVAAGPLPALGSAWSTHGLGLGEALELGRVLGRLPARCVLFAIQGKGYEHGAPLSAAARRAMDDVHRRILAELRQT